MNQAHVKVLPFFKQWAIEVNKIYIEFFVIEEHYLDIFYSDYQLVILSDDLFSILSGIYFQYNECDIINDIINCKQSILSIINISINFEIGEVIVFYIWILKPFFLIVMKMVFVLQSLSRVYLRKNRLKE